MHRRVGAVLLGLCLLAPVEARAEARRVRKVLSDGWYVKQVESAKPDIARLAAELDAPGESWLSAKMPAQVHDVLLQHRRIPDPRLSDNAAKVKWVGDRDWVYGCKFANPGAASGPVFLEFQGLDTLATVYLNGAEIGSFDNMFRQYRVDVRKHLAPVNRLIVVFRSVTKYLDEFNPPPEHAGKIPKPRYLRKAAPDFSSYLGARPDFIKVGIFRDVVLDLPASSWIEDVWVRPELSRDLGSAKLKVQVETAGANRPVQYRLLDPAGSEQAKRTTAAKEFSIDIAKPKLWWPRMNGPQNLYRLSVSLNDGPTILDSREVRVGIRDARIALTDPATGEKRFRFDVNGRPIYFRGGCWAPIEHMSHVWQPERARRLLDLAENGNMNIFRIWGEGSEPPQEFYDECDRRGIMIWHDFMFANGMEPTDIPAFAANCRTEIEGQVRRVRNHPSLLLWAGGNENYMSVEFAGKQFTIGNNLFLEMMPDIVRRMDPSRYYHPSSPYGGRNPNWPLEGDWHDYTTIEYEPEASVPLWSSEVLRASAPSLSSMRQFLREDELWPKGWNPAVRKPGEPAWPPAWTYHSTGVGTWDRIGAIERYIDPASAGDLIRNIGTAHGEYLQERVERQRRGVPDGAPSGSRRNWGNTVWRFNDPWPEIYSSVIDYYVEPKIAYYYLRRSYDPVLVSFERTADWIAVWITNDSPEPVSGRLNVRRRKFTGNTVGELNADVALAPAESKRVLKLTELGPISLRNEFLEATFGERDATLLMAAERYLRLPSAKLTARRSGDVIEVSAGAFARQVTFEFEGAVGAAFEDNFFDMAPGQRRTVRILNTGGGRELSVKALNSERIALK